MGEWRGWRGQRVHPEVRRRTCSTRARVWSLSASWRVMNGWARQTLVSITPEVRLGETGIYKKSEAWRSVKRPGYAIQRVFVSVPLCHHHALVLPTHSHSSFPTPPTLDAVHPRVVEENITTYTSKCLVHCQPDRLTRGIRVQWTRMNLLMIIEFFTFYHGIYTFFYSNTI